MDVDLEDENDMSLQMINSILGIFLNYAFNY